MKYKTNNNLKERPLIFGLKDTNFIYVAMVGLAALVLSVLIVTAIGFSIFWCLGVFVLSTSVTFYLMKQVQNRETDADYYLDRRLSFMMQGQKKFYGNYSNNKLFVKKKK